MNREGAKNAKERKKFIPEPLTRIFTDKNFDNVGFIEK
jgi:hypothetical protein